MSKALITAVRQYRHNNSDGLLFGYDAEETNKIVADMESLIAKQQLEIEELKILISEGKDRTKDALLELIYAEQWSPKAQDFPRVSMNAIVRARYYLEE